MFQVDGRTVVKLGAEDVPALRELFARCHAFMTLVYGSPEPDAAEQLLESLPPGKTLEDKFAFGLFVDGTKQLLGLLDSVRGYPESDEWIIGMLLVDPDHRRTGLRGHRHDAPGDAPAKELHPVDAQAARPLRISRRLEMPGQEDAQ